MSMQSMLFNVALLVGLCWSSVAPAYGLQDTVHPGAKSGTTKPKPKKTQKTTGGTSQRGVTATDSPAESAASVGPYYALVIGNNNYRTPVPKLKTAVFDAKEVAKLLQEGYKFSATKLLLNATRKDIIVALNEYRRLPAKSSLLIYYAGHGQKDPRTNKAYWLPVDADLDNDVNWISASTITEEIGAIPSQHVLIISDSCYSGELTRGLPPIQINAMERQAYFRRMLESPSRTLMSSGRDEPVADDGSAGHSRFAYVLLASMQQIQEDTFTAGYLFQTYVQQAVGGELGSEQVPQYSPIMNSGHQWGDFVFSRKPGFKPIIGLDQGHAGNNGDTTGTDSSNTDDGRHRTDGDHPPDNHSTGDADADRIKDVLNRYADAYNMRDAGILGQIWPGLPARTRTTLDNAFKSASSISMSLRVATPAVSPDGQSATARAQFTEIYTPRDGGAQPPRSGDLTFTLRKKNGNWTITDIK
jgi:uncharacterized caspase-like protein